MNIIIAVLALFGLAALAVWTAEYFADWQDAVDIDADNKAGEE
jgi:hypothetical protein